MRFLLMAIFMAGMVLTGAAFAADTPGPTQVTSATSGPVVVGWNVVRTQVDAVTVTWTPSAAGAYTIDVTVGLSTGRIQTPLIEAAIQRTDLVPITQPVDVEVVGTVEVVIFET
jgi:hypothetical protein